MIWGTIIPLNAELNQICHLLVLLGSHNILHVSRIRVNSGQSARKSSTGPSLTSLLKRRLLCM